MKTLDFFLSGLGRVVRAPALIFWVYMTSVAFALPLAAAMRDILKESIGASLMHENLRRGFDLDWYGEFSFERSGLAETFGPRVVGILPVLSNLERLIEGNILSEDKTIIAAGALFLLAWAFFAGGIIGRYARMEELHSRSRFFSEGADYFFRFVRLLVISLLIYLGIFRWVARPLHQWVEGAIRDVTVERTVMFYTALIYLLVAFLLMLTSMALDYAKIAMVVEKRTSSILACFRGLRFVLSNPGQTVALYLSLVLVGAVLLFFYAAVAPGPGQARRLTVILAFILGQAFILARLILKLWFLASQTTLFQSSLKVTEPSAPITPLGGA